MRGLTILCLTVGWLVHNELERIWKGTLELEFDITSIHPSIYGATAPSRPWPPSQDASIHLYSQLFSSILLHQSFN